VIWDSLSWIARLRDDAGLAKVAGTLLAHDFEDGINVYSA
jgi:hypothetical protein